MKKYLKIFLIALIVVLASILNVYAADSTTDLTLTADKTEVKVGEVVTINLSANCESGIEGIDGTLEYNKTKLELQNLNVDAKFSNMSGEDDATGEYKLTVISNSTETLTSATFVTLQFEVLDTAQVDEELTVKLSGIELGDSNDEWTILDDKEVTLKVVEEIPGIGDNNQGEDNNPGTGDINQGEDNNQGTGNNNQGTGDNDADENNNKPSTNTGKEDNTQADKEISHAGLENYAPVISAVIAVIVFISYKKYHEYKNI